MASQEALVEPALLVWARTSMGYQPEAAAKKIGVSAERLLAWEAGTERPTVAQLRHVASVYKRPLAIFYLPEPPKAFEAMRDFRRAGGAQTLSPALNYSIRTAWERRQAALDLAGDMDVDHEPMTIKVQETDPPESVAHQIRGWLGITLEIQCSWGDERKAFSAWKSAIEHNGMLVFQTRRVESEEARGFSIGEEVLPVIAVNGRDTPAGKTFTLLHELTHVLLRVNGICQITDDSSDPSIEKFCNAVAALCLVPSGALLTQPEVRDHPRYMNWTDGELRKLARRFGASREVVLRRLVEVDRASASFYRQKRAEFERQYKAMREQRKEVNIPQHIMALARNGSLFTNIVLSAYHRGNINLSEVSNYLGLRPRYVESLETEMYMRSS